MVDNKDVVADTEIDVELSEEDEKLYVPNEEALKAAYVKWLAWKKKKNCYKVIYDNGTSGTFLKEELLSKKWILPHSEVSKTQESVAEIAENPEASTEEPKAEKTPEIIVVSKVEEHPEPDAPTKSGEAKEPELPIEEAAEPEGTPEVVQEAATQEVKEEPEEVIEEDPYYTPEPDAVMEEKELLRGFDWELDNPGHCEDSRPFRDEDLVVVCDGMGGTGGAKLILENDEKKFGEDAWAFMDSLETDAKLKDFCGNLYQDLVRLFASEDGKMIDATNAAFASRIVCARYAYVKRHRFLDLTPLLSITEETRLGSRVAKKWIDMAAVERKMLKANANYLPSFAEADLNDKDYLEKAMTFITYGLARLANTYGLTPGSNVNVAVLPTTLASAYTHQVGGKRVTDVIWCGDSRVYAFVKEKGLQILSADDEDPQTHIMNNFFTPERLGELHHNRYEDLPEDTIIFGCSDGWFDPFPLYDHVAIANFYSSLLREDAEAVMSKEKWAAYGERIKANYKKYQQDDITVSLNVYGFKKASKGKDFNLIDEEVEKLFAEAYPQHHALDYFDKRARGVVVNDDPIGSRCKVLPSRYPDKIAQLYFAEGERDIAMSPELVSFLNGFIPAPREDTETIVEKIREKIVGVKDSGSFENLLDLIVPAEGNSLYQKADALIKADKEFDHVMKTPITFEYKSVEDYNSVMWAIKDAADMRKVAYDHRNVAIKDFEEEVIKAVSNKSIRLSLKNDEREKIEASVPRISLTLDEKLTVITEAIKNNGEKVSLFIADALKANYESTSALDVCFNQNTLKEARAKIALSMEYESKKEFYSVLLAKMKTATILRDGLSAK